MIDDARPATGRDHRRITAGTVLYAENVQRVSNFYAAVLGLTVTDSESYHVVLESPTYQLAVVEMPAHLAASVKVAEGGITRRETAIKLFFVVASIDDARPVVAAHGGQLRPPDRVWRFEDWRACDGSDPEGNAIQLRELR
jgi:predicted enzyme related to lactoylglutathione lyase